MYKIFLSHSSNDKSYVEIVAKKLKKYNLVYDSWTFDAGEKTIDEIYKSIEETGLFVLFISESSLKSAWVKREIFKAKSYIKNGKIKRFYPIIISKTITYDHEDIPKWIKEEYNLHYISKPVLCSRKIEQKYREVVWELKPNIKHIDSIFVGRTEEISILEQRLADFNKKTTCIIASGLKSIGRRKFLYHSLKKNYIMRETYQPYVISLDERQSIEDLILSLYNCAYTDIQESLIENLIVNSIDEKINILLEIFNELYEQKEIVVIEDNHCIVQRDSSIVPWFNTFVERCDLDKLVLCLLSEQMVRYSKDNSDKIFHIKIPPLNKQDRALLLNAVLSHNKMELTSTNKTYLLEVFTGYPEQIFFTINLILDSGIDYVLENMDLVTNYSNDKISFLTNKYGKEDLFMNILLLLSQSNIFTFKMIEQVVKDDWNIVKNYLDILYNNFFIDYIDTSKEYLQLNSIVKDYVQRLGLQLSDKYKENLKEYIDKSISKGVELFEDLSSFMFVGKELLKRQDSANNFIPLLIPSVYINALAELYYERRYNNVIKIATKILEEKCINTVNIGSISENSDNLDGKVRRELLYWKCSALARIRDVKFLEEVQQLSGDDKHFLLGFYYRLTGKHQKAIEHLKLVKSHLLYYRVSRELVQVYLNMELYEDALKLAEESYNRDKNNPYIIQSYFRCIIKLKGKQEKELLNILLQNLQNSLHKKAKEMYLTSKAQYYTYIENDFTNALECINEAIGQFGDNIYPYIHKLEILYTNLKDYNELERVVQIIDDKFVDQNDVHTNSYKYLPYLIAKYIIARKHGDMKAAKYIEEINKNFPTYDVNKLSSFM